MLNLCDTTSGFHTITMITFSNRKRRCHSCL